MRRIPIRMKLAGALTVPLFALVVVTVLEVVKSSQDADRARQQAALAEASIGPTSLLSMLENERNAAAVYLLGAEDDFALPVEDNAEARRTVDEALAVLRNEVESRGGEVEAAYRPAIEAMAALDDLRRQVDSAPEESRNLQNIDVVSGIFDGYTELMAAFFDANKRVSLAVDDPELRRGAELVDLSARQTDLIAILVKHLLLAQVGGSNPDGLNTPQELAEVASHLGLLRMNEQLIVTKGTGRYREHVEALFAAEEIQRFPQVVDEAIATGTVDLVGVMTYSAGEDPDTFGYTVFRRNVSDTLTEHADELVDAAVARQRWFIALAALSVLMATTVTWLVSRSITRPLRALTRQAKDMAERRLPEAVMEILQTPLGEDVVVPEVEPIAVTTRDEVADVSAALNTVQDTALDLAVEQAVLRRNIADSFVNLGRRNQNLLGRQLDFITELESKETDPDTLANLFRLDHLATRMRRNAESLLVLAGVEPPRKWAAPVRLTDVIRAALGEVEDYQRVTVRGVEPATIVGSAAADVAHLLAELIENALVFSPPDQTVDIRGRGNDDGGYTLAIIDSGLGMSPEDIAAANRRLAGLESFTIAPSKYLGHYVAGNLAARHGIKVRLDNSPGNGITATVELPPTLLTTDTTNLAAPVTPPHGIRALPTTAPAAEDTAPEPSPPPPPAEPAPPVERTPSGLAKRATRAGNGQTAPVAPPDELIDTLSRHVAGLQSSGATGAGQPGHGSAPDRAGNGSPWGPPGAPGSSGAEPPWGSPAAPGGSPAGGSPWGAPPAPGGSPVGGSPAGRSWPAPSRGGTPPSRDRQAPAPPSPGSGGWSPPAAPQPGGWSPPTADRTASGTPQPPPAAAPGGAAPSSGTTTPGGLARRVKGAQMPATQPLRMRRGGQEGGSDAPGAGAGTPPPRTAEQRRKADDVYNFLSQFTAGVQRGIEESRR